MKKSKVISLVLLLLLVLALTLIPHTPAKAQEPTFSFNIAQIQPQGPYNPDQKITIKGSISYSNFENAWKGAISEGSVSLHIEWREDADDQWPEVPDVRNAAGNLMMEEGGEWKFFERKHGGETQIWSKDLGIPTRHEGGPWHESGEVDFEITATIPEKCVAARLRATLDRHYGRHHYVDFYYYDYHPLSVGEVTLDSDGDGVPNDEDQCNGTPAGVAVDEKGCPKYSDLESNWTVDDNPSLKGQIYGVVPNAGNAGEITGEPGLSDPTTDKEKIEARLAEIEKLSAKEREKYRDEVAQLYDQLYHVNRHEELVWMLEGGLITVTDKSMGYYTPTALVWGISTGLTSLVMGNYNDGMNRLIGVIPWKNLGTAYSGLLDLGIITPISPGDTGGGTKGGYKRYYHAPQPSYTGILGVLPPVP